MNKKQIEKGVKEILLGLGENLNSEHIKRTPERVARLYENLFIGYGPKPEITKFKNIKGVDDLQARKCDFVSFCPHHVVPYSGNIYVGYLPGNYLIGMDKIDLIVDYCAGRLQIQEDLCHEIADFLMTCFQPKGVMVQAYAVHNCALCKGNPGSFASSAVRGVMKANDHMKQEVSEMFKRLDELERGK